MRDYVRPVALALVVTATAIFILWPLSLSWSALQSLPTRLVGAGAPILAEPRDVVANVLAFLPLGLLASLWLRWPPARIAWLALLISLALEVIQIFQPARIVSPLDVALNMAGAIAGALAPILGGIAARALSATRIGPEPVAAGGIGVSMLVFTALQGGFASPGNWSPEYPLMIGNEATGDRPWCGQVTDLVMSAGGQVWRADSLHLSRRLAADHGTPCDWQQSTQPAARIAEAVNRSHHFHITLRALPSALSQTGPARIVSLSATPGERNLTIGQDGRDLIVRVRRRWAGDQGTRPFYRLRDVFQTRDAPAAISVEVGTDSSVVAANGLTLVDRHRVERQWWILLLPEYEWRWSLLEIPGTLMFWLLLFSPGCLLAGCAAAQGRRSSVSTPMTCAILALGAWAGTRLAGVAIGGNSAALMATAAAMLSIAGYVFESGRRRRRGAGHITT